MANQSFSLSQLNPFSSHYGARAHVEIDGKRIPLTSPVERPRPLSVSLDDTESRTPRRRRARRS